MLIYQGVFFCAYEMCVVTVHVLFDIYIYICAYTYTHTSLYAETKQVVTCSDAWFPYSALAVRVSNRPYHMYVYIYIYIYTYVIICS